MSKSLIPKRANHGRVNVNSTFQSRNVQLKPGSESVLSTEVSEDFELEFGIPLLEKAEVFGWWITNTASPAVQWKDMCRKAW